MSIQIPSASASQHASPDRPRLAWRHALAALVGAATVMALPTPAAAAPLRNPTPVTSIDLNRYAGRWYEVSRTPNFFEINCTCVTATYGVTSPSSISVYNACNKGSPTGALNPISGAGNIPDPAQPGKIVLTLGGVPVPADYWIVDLVEDASNPGSPYQFAAVSGPTDFIFILSRQPALDTPEYQAAYQGVLDRLKAQRLPIKRLRDTPQPATCNYDAQQP